jgi:hypothetical protein
LSPLYRGYLQAMVSKQYAFLKFIFDEVKKYFLKILHMLYAVGVFNN